MAQVTLREFCKQILEYATRSGVLTPLILTSLLINILTISIPLYVILIFTKYINYGNYSTLFSLTIGICIFILLEVLLRHIRFIYSNIFSINLFKDINSNIITKFLSSKDNRIYTIKQSEKEKLLRGTNDIMSRFSSENISIVLDLPFCIIFLLIIYLINDFLAFCIFIYCLFFVLVMTLYQRKLKSISSVNTGSIENTSPFIRYFSQFTSFSRLAGNAKAQQRKFEQRYATEADSRSEISWQKHIGRINSRTASSLITVVTIAIGSYIVVQGEMNIGELIGINILAVRTIAPITSIANLYDTLVSSSQFFNAYYLFKQLRDPRDDLLTPNIIIDKIEIKNLSFAFPGNRELLFGPINIDLASSDILIIRGESGSGKSVLLNLMYADLTPSAGDIYVNGIPLQEIEIDWWQNHISYQNEAEGFYPGTLRDEFKARHYNINDEEIISCICDVGMKSVLSSIPDILDRPSNYLINSGNHSLHGLMRVAIALSNRGPIIMLDNPTKNLNSDSKNYIYKLLNNLASNNKTIICVTEDPQIIRGGTYFLDLSNKENINNSV